MKCATPSRFAEPCPKLLSWHFLILFFFFKIKFKKNILCSYIRVTASSNKPALKCLGLGLHTPALDTPSGAPLRLRDCTRFLSLRAEKKFLLASRLSLLSFLFFSFLFFSSLLFSSPSLPSTPHSPPSLPSRPLHRIEVLLWGPPPHGEA